ncbi:v-type proton ATPase catalytic subunit A [Striga asiatica]|uniref:V-type proton ATPase catalytic subunit A n=1 Tax=Striga asiatica TaxID=4170 RepID=A0A5A7R3X3_STRAF|nr:v-type proton ATPase catalytic subunit A [Striga asiatica]
MRLVRYSPKTGFQSSFQALFIAIEVTFAGPRSLPVAPFSSAWTSAPEAHVQLLWVKREFARVLLWHLGGWISVTGYHIVYPSKDLKVRKYHDANYPIFLDLFTSCIYLTYLIVR